MNITTRPFSFFALFIVLVTISNATKILFVGCQNSKSHMGSLLPLAKKLSANGFDVTYYMPILEPMPEPGGGVKSAFPFLTREEDSRKQVAEFIWKGETSALIMFFIFNVGNQALQMTLDQKPEEFWAVANDTWDLVVVDELFTTGGYGMALLNHQRQGKPIAVFSTTNPLNTLTAATSLGRSPLKRPSFYINNVEPFEWSVTRFFDRFTNFKDTLIEHLAVDTLTILFSTSALRAIGIKSFSWHDYYSKTSINFIDYPDRYMYPEAIGSNMIYTGSVCSNAKPLSSDLLKFVNDPSSKGTIYVAFGSFVNWDYAPKPILDAFLDAVNALTEYRIIWGFQGTPPSNISNHVKILSWAPQNDILHHEKTRLFISHGGLKSLKESICSETPVLFMPIFAEQNMNALIAKQLGYAEIVTKYTVTKDDVVSKCKKVLDNNSYLKVVKKIKGMFLDRIVHPLDEGLFWANKTIRYAGKRVNFRRNGSDQYWYEYLCMDSLAFAFLFIEFLVIVDLTPIDVEATKKAIRLKHGGHPSTEILPPALCFKTNSASGDASTFSNIGKMDPVCREALDKIRSFFNPNMTNLSVLTPILISANALNSSELERIEKSKTNYDRADALLTELMKKDNHAYETLLKGLRVKEVNKSYIAAAIEKKEDELRDKLSNK